MGRGAWPAGSGTRPGGWGEDDSETPILHVDMDAFFASVELVTKPGLRGLPVIVGGHERGVVLAATYEARALGVHSAMPMARALALCPAAVVIPPDHGAYREASRRVMAILAEVTPEIEQISVDEAFLDVSGARRRLGSPAAIGALIRRRIAGELGLAASVGVAQSLFVAKLASTRAKPDGLLVVPAQASVAFVQSLDVGSLWGVGEATARKLKDSGIHTVAELAQMPVSVLQARLGTAAGSRLYDLAWARDGRSVTTSRVEKSISSEHTFTTDVKDEAALVRTLLEQSHRCARRLRSSELVAGGVAIKVRMADFTTLTRSRRFATPTDVGQEIYAAARTLFAGVKIAAAGARLVGVRVDDLESAHGAVQQFALGEDSDSVRALEQVIDRIGARFGEGAAQAGSLIRPRASTTTTRELS